MTLQDIFDHLTFGELSQLFVGGAETQGITVDNRHQVLSHINLGLTELHKRFFLREGRIVVALDPDIRTYRLDSRYAASNDESLEPVKYLQDSPSDPFEDDAIKIERVFGDDGKEITLNDENDPEGVFVTAPTTLWVPEGLDTTTLRIDYRANHPIIDKEAAAFQPEEITVALPWTHLQPLLFFVASRAHDPFGANETMHVGNNYAARFERACLELEKGGYQVSRQNQTTKFEQRGFV